MATHSTAGPAPALTGARAGAFAVYRVLIALYALAILVQIFLAGLGIFDADGSPIDDNASEALDPHRAIGHILTQPVMLVILIVALIARPGLKIVQFTIALLVMGIVQVVLAIAGEDAPFLGGLHAINALIVFGLAVECARRAGAFAMLRR